MEITERNVTLRVLTPSDGHLLTDGSGVWADKVYLGALDTADRWREATQEEYDAWQATQTNEV